MAEPRVRPGGGAWGGLKYVEKRVPRFKCVEKAHDHENDTEIIGTLT